MLSTERLKKLVIYKNVVTDIHRGDMACPFKRPEDQAWKCIPGCAFFSTGYAKVATSTRTDPKTGRIIPVQQDMMCAFCAAATMPLGIVQSDLSL